MAVVNVKSVYGTTVKEYYIGASTDSKPTDVPIGAKFLESDTNTTYIFGADRTWSIDPEHQSLNKVWNADSLEWDRMTQPLVNISNASLFVELTSMDAQFTSINAKLTSQVSAQISAVLVLNNMSTRLGSIENMLDPLARYGLGFIDAGSATSYYGFQDRVGAWYVMRISNASYLYYQNSANFDTGWGSRATLSYNSFAGAF